MSFTDALYLTAGPVAVVLILFVVVIVLTNRSVSRGLNSNSRYINRSHNTDYKIGEVDATLVNCEI